jgi:hypothetical protein
LFNSSGKQYVSTPASLLVIIGSIGWKIPMFIIYNII